MSLRLEDLKYDALHCVRCSNCKWMDHVYMKSYRFSQICPSLKRYLFDAYSCQGRLDIALAIMNKKLEYTPTLLDIIYKCTLCGACDVMCKRCMDLEPLQVLEALRVKWIESGGEILPEHRKLIENIENTNNIYGEAHERRLESISKEVVLKEKADVIYFVGCASAYKYPEIAHATIEILRKCETEFTLLYPDEWCCGNPLYAIGRIDLMKKVMEHNLKAIRETGASVVITSCAACYKTLKVDYPKLLKKSTDEMEFKVMHIVEYLDRLLKDGRLKLKELNMKLTYHDPCQLGRLSEPWIHWEGKRKKYGLLDPPKKFRRGTYGVYDPPRNLLKSIRGVELIEMERIKENAWCCGAGGGVKQAFPDFALWTASERLEEAKATGAEAIVTACPFCKENFEDAVKAAGEKIKVYDITEIIRKVLV
ncbi:MAG: (Fe-S)-binding protein [Candidatus Baldrarchaeia archaeon]